MSNRGALALKALGLTQAEVARAVGTDQSVISRWERAERTPATNHRVKLFEVYQIGLGWWDEPAEESAPESGRPSAEPAERAS